MQSSGALFEIPFGCRTISASFDGGSLSSDGGLLLLRQVDKKLGLTRRPAGCIRDGRDQSKIEPSIAEMLSQRVFGIAVGYEDCNDHDSLRADPMPKLAADRAPMTGDDLASQPTLSRLENSISSTGLMRMQEVLLEGSIAGHRGKRVRRLVINADATDDPAHGQHEFEFFHGFYDCRCFVPLLVYVTADDGEQELVASVLRPGNVHPGHKLVSVLKRVVARLVAEFPRAEVVFRGDAGMALPGVYASTAAESRGESSRDDAPNMADDADELSCKGALYVHCIQAEPGAGLRKTGQTLTNAGQVSLEGIAMPERAENLAVRCLLPVYGPPRLRQTARRPLKTSLNSSETPRQTHWRGAHE